MICCPFLLSGTILLCSPQKDELAGHLAELNRLRDDVKPALIEKIANHKSRRAMQGLVSVYPHLKTIYMRREVVRSLAKFDGVAESEQPALELALSVATTAKARELRRAAVACLGECAHLGNHFLSRIVDSEVHDDLRLLALRTHVKRAKESDARWYRFVWNPRRENRKKGKGVDVPELEAIRETAFGGLAKFLGDRQLVDTMKSEFNPKIRRAALETLRKRGSKKTKTMATWLFKRTDIPGTERIVAAKMLVELQDPNIVSTFLALAKKQFVTPEDLRQAMADLIVGMKDKATDKRVARLIGRGKPHEKVFALRATKHLNDPTLLKRIRRGLTDKSFEVRRATARSLGKREDRDSLPALREMMRKPEMPSDARVAIEAICEIEKGAAAWVRELQQLCKSNLRETRNTAVHELGRLKDTAHMASLTEGLAHDDWTTRLVALQALAAFRQKTVVAALIGRLPKERGRMSKEMADVLWRLTGQSFEENATKWQAWWKNEGEKFHVISEDDLARAEKDRELARLRQRTQTPTEFFGIRIESDRVIFIIDTSGSMVYLVHGKFVGKRAATRLDVAKKELSRCIESLTPKSLFNVIAFSFGIGRWVKSGIAASSQHTRKDALTFVKRLGAGGPTNLYDTLQIAFEDPDVDTIYLLSDGEPTTGKVMDPARIRQDVKFWNRHRQVKIHTIAIGGNLEILEWLAKDSNGEHVKIR